MKNTCFSGLDNCLKPLLKNGVENGVFSGGAAAVYTNTNNDEKHLVICQGKTRKDSKAIQINDTTLFDLASLTKPLCTVLLTLHLVERKKIGLHTSIQSILGEKTGQISKEVTIAHLLSHSSGLAAYKPYYRDFLPIVNKENKEKLLARIFHEKTAYGVGEKYLYSDLGYLLLGEMIERVSGENIDDLFTSSIAKPLGLEKDIFFRPVDIHANKGKKNIAATQECPWRKRILQGEVDDEHCWLMNGVAGHAGLFGTIKGVLGLTTHILDQWKGRAEHPSYSNALLKKALTRVDDKQTWCLGFDTPSQEGSSGGRYLSKESVGHLGFTGTSFWIDPEKDMVVVLLTNRVHPTRNNEKIKEFRPLFHNTVFEHLWRKK